MGVFLMVMTMAVKPEDIGEIKADVRTLIDLVKSLVKSDADSQRTIGVLCEQMQASNKRIEDHETRIRAVTTEVGVIKAIVFPQSRGPAGKPNSANQPDSPSAKIILAVISALSLAASAIIAILYVFVKDILPIILGGKP